MADGKYRVIMWGEPVNRPKQTFDDLPAARRYCRALGYAGNLVSGDGKYYAPLAYVVDDTGLLVYNPRFFKEREDAKRSDKP